MPTIKLTDALGLDLKGNVAAGASLSKILPAFARLADLRLDEMPVGDASMGLQLSQPIDVTAGGIALKIGASAGARFALIQPRQRALDEDDPFNEIAVKEDEIYIALALSFSLSGELGGSASSFTFGYSRENQVEMRCYRRFQRGPDGFPAFRKALAAAASSFILPKDADDLRGLQPDTVLVLRGTGTLTVSAGVSVSLPTESLASVSLAGDLKLGANAGGQAGVDASLTITGGYQVRLRRLDARKVELGVYTIKSRAADLSVSANVGVSAQAGPVDLGEKVIAALSSQPAVDVEEFKRALPGEDDTAKEKRIEGFQASIEAAISTKLQASVKVAFSSLESHEAAWLFEIDPGVTLTSDARTVLSEALDGRLALLTRDARRLPAGIARISNILTDTDLHKLTLKVNLLGIVNLISAGKLVQVTTAERDAHGDITLIADTSSASRLKALLIAFGNDRKRLRKLLSENFLIEAAYRAAALGVLPPEFKARHSYFEIEDSTSREELKDHLDVARIFGLVTPDEVARFLGANKHFGRTEFYAEARYTNNAVRDAFLQPQGMAASAGQYENIGRSALRALLAGDEGQEFRKQIAENDSRWQELKKDGDRANFARIFGLPAGTLDPRVEAAGADFSAITSWADAMGAAGKAIQELDSLLGGGSVAADEPRLAQARELLKRRLADVVANTREEFGDPLGMVMFYVAANQNAGRTIILTGDQVQRIERSAPGPIAVPAT